MFTMPVARMSVLVASSSRSTAARSALGEPPSHSAPYPACSMPTASSGVVWPTLRQIPNRPRRVRQCSVITTSCAPVARPLEHSAGPPGYRTTSPLAASNQGWLASNQGRPASTQGRLARRKGRSPLPCRRARQETEGGSKPLHEKVVLTMRLTWKDVVSTPALLVLPFCESGLPPSAIRPWLVQLGSPAPNRG